MYFFCQNNIDLKYTSSSVIQQVEVYLKYTWSIVELCFKYTLEVNFRCIWSILKVYLTLVRVESYILVKLCNNCFLLSYRTKVLKFRSMRVKKTLSILIQRKQHLKVILTFKSHQNKKSINSTVACLMISPMICHFVFVNSKWFIIGQAGVLQVNPQIEKWIASFRSTCSRCHNVCGKHLIWQARIWRMENIWERKGGKL